MNLDACLDEEIDRQRVVLSNLYYRKNFRIPIFRLPTETLTNIFILNARDYHHSQKLGSSSLSVPGWVNISYVCRHWRNVAINCPTLWSYVFMTSQRWTEELLARSKQAPLKILADVNYISRIFKPVADHVEHIEELCLRLPHSNSSRQFLTKFRSSPAPRLQHLEISDAGNSDVLPLFQGETPALRQLKLRSCSMSLDSFMISGLTTLSLHEIPCRFRLHVTEFLVFLGHMPSLVHLDTCNALISTKDYLSSNAFSATSKINLTHLSYLSITDPFSTIIALLSCVNIPQTARIRLSQSPFGDSATDEYNQLLSVLAQRFGSGDLLHTVPTLRLLVIQNESSSSKLVFSTSEHTSDNLEEQDSNIFFNIRLMRSYFIPPLDDDRIISGICHSLPLANIQNLLFSGHQISTCSWRILLGQLPDLRYMKLNEGHMPDIASLLSLTLTSDPSAQDVNAELKFLVTTKLEEDLTKSRVTRVKVMNERIFS